MTEVRLKLRAKLISANDRAAIILQEGECPIWVSLAFVERETDELILPESILDDWGREIKSLALYHWIRENGEQFPRAELFGVRPNGIPVQRFLREIDLTAKYPCFARNNFKEALDSKARVDFVFMIKENVDAAKRVNPPRHISFPFRSIRAEWWQIPEPKLKDLEAILLQPSTLNFEAD